MNYVFFGTPEFAAIILEKLIAAHWLPQAVVCNPDRPVGRKKIISSPITKLVAQKHNILILQPEVLSISNFQFPISNYDFFIVAAYARLLPNSILNIPKWGAIGVHPSLLPKYRGPTPIQTAILNGDAETGVTLYLMDEKIDHGPILATSHLPLATSDNYENLLKTLAGLAGNLLIETLPKFVKDGIVPMPQDDSKATYTKKFTAHDGFVNEEILRQAQEGTNFRAAIDIERRIRALNPEPGVYTLRNQKRTKLLEAEIINRKLALKTIQLEGKKPQTIQ